MSTEVEVPEPASPVVGSWRPARWRTRTHPRWWQEFLFIGVSYFLYSLVRNGAPTNPRLALARADDIYRLQDWLNIDWELAFNRWLDHISWLVVPANYYYATAHFVVTPVVLVWIFRQHPIHYRPLRTALYVSGLLALVGYWLYPLAPPRLMDPNPGFIDTVITHHTWGDLANEGYQASNQFAAMPSMHMGWSIWCAIAVFVLARRWWVRALGIAHPVTMLLVITGTANHFILDAVAGAAVLAVGFGVQRLISGLPAIPGRAPPPEH